MDDVVLTPTTEPVVHPETGEIITGLYDFNGIDYPATTEAPATDPPEEHVPPGGIDQETARAQARIFQKAAVASPVRQWRYLFDAMADEWIEAAVSVDESMEYYSMPTVIELAGSVTRGMKFYDRAAGFLRVSRVIKREGDWSLVCVIVSADQLQYTNNKRELYVNLLGAESPVAVMR